MEAKDLANRFVKRLRRRAEDYRRMKTGPALAPGEPLLFVTIAGVLDEAADCMEEALETFDEE